MLKPVSETAQPDGDPAGPTYPKAFPAPPFTALWDNITFTQGQPFDAFRRMREEAPVQWQDVPDMPGYWALTRYDDVLMVERDPETFSSQRGGINMAYGKEGSRHPQLHRAALDTMICLDAPYHLPLRREHMPFFTPGYVAQLKTRVETKIAALLDAMAARGPKIDMVEMFSAELPLYTLSEMLGIDESDRPKLIRWMHYLENASQALARRAIGDIDPDFLMKFLDNVHEMFEYGQHVLKDRRRHPREDLLTAIAHAKIDGKLLSDEFLDGSWLLIVFAGNDTTRNSLSGTMKLLTENPDQKLKLINDPSKIGTMVHEAIRMVSPVIYMRRTATRDTEIRGQKIAEGEKVIMYYGAANRDPAVFTDPDLFDVDRPNAKDHIAFGNGPHVCLGNRVANMQLEAAYRQILARFPKIAWTGEIEIAPNNFVHAISRLGIDLGS